MALEKLQVTWKSFAKMTKSFSVSISWLKRTSKTSINRKNNTKHNQGILKSVKMKLIKSKRSLINLREIRKTKLRRLTMKPKLRTKLEKLNWPTKTYFKVNHCRTELYLRLILSEERAARTWRMQTVTLMTVTTWSGLRVLRTVQSHIWLETIKDSTECTSEPGGWLQKPVTTAWEGFRPKVIPFHGSILNIRSNLEQKVWSRMSSN